MILPGLLLTMLLAMLDQTVVATAMPHIVGELGGVAHLSWVVTAYTLAMTVSTPLYGKLGDLYGRKRFFMFAVVLFLVGSALSGLSQDMNQLIAFRALQGLGGGGLIVGVMSIIGDLIPPRERGKYQGYFAATMTLGMLIGPLTGGVLTDHLSWRWAFYINLPIGIVALAVVSSTLHLPSNRLQHKIDYLGATLLGAAATALVLVTTWGGTQYDWGSGIIIGLIAVGVIAAAAFLWAETRAVEPILPLRLFRDRNFSLASAISCVLGFVMFGAIIFLPFFQQAVQHSSATNSGLLLLPLLLGMMVTSLVTGQVITRTGHYRSFPVIGGAIMTVGMYLLSTMDVETSKFTTSAFMVILGVGMGFLMQLTLMLAQNSVDRRDMGAASSTSMFTRTIGGAFGVSIFGAIFTSRLTESLAGASGLGDLAKAGANIDPGKLSDLPAGAQDAYAVAVAHGSNGVFLWSALFAVVVFVLALAIKAVPMRSTNDPVPEPTEPSGPTEDPELAPSSAM